VKYWLEVSQRPSSLDAPIGEDGRESQGDTVSDPDAKSPFDELNRQPAARGNGRAPEDVDRAERIILERRFGLNGLTAESLEEVGARLKITRERVRQLQNQALATLRELMLKE
jgi:RNA polymerase primary sigma factor